MVKVNIIRYYFQTGTLRRVIHISRDHNISDALTKTNSELREWFREVMLTGIFKWPQTNQTGQTQTLGAQPKYADDSTTVNEDAK